jgi:phage FluMu protein Com
VKILNKLFKKKLATMKMWERTDDIYGHKPTFPINCRHCESKMLLRFSEVYTERSMTFAIKQAVNVVEYKCPRCSLTQKFYVEDEPEYLLDILDLRGGIRLFIPPKEVWERESEEIKKRLELLGYM